MSNFMILLAIIALIAFYIIYLFNSVITLRNRTHEAWSDIDVQLKRRYDLIPNLVESVRGYAKHEEGVFTKVTQARASAMSAQGAGQQAQAENMLKDALKSLFAVVESYPELKANTNFLKLQEDLKDTENKIEASRRFYNGNVRDFNTLIQKFPNNMIAGQLGFKQFEFFDIADAAQRENVKVDFNQAPQTATPPNSAPPTPQVETPAPAAPAAPTPAVAPAPTAEAPAPAVSTPPPVTSAPETPTPAPTPAPTEAPKADAPVAPTETAPATAPKDDSKPAA
jgi:LemA protein